MPLIRKYTVRKKKPSLRQQVTTLSALLLTGALLAGIWYFAVERAPAERDPGDATWTTLEPGGEPSGAAENDSAGTPSGRSSTRTATIIRCHDPEIGEFYTNAATCAEADPHNRITVAEPLATNPAENTYSGQNYTTPEQDAGNSRSD